MLLIISYRKLCRNPLYEIPAGEADCVPVEDVRRRRNAPMRRIRQSRMFFILQERASYQMRTLRAGSQGLPGRRGGAAAKEKMQPEASRRRRCIRLHRILFYHIGKSGLSDKTFREDRHAAEGKMQPEASRRRRCIRLHRILFYHIGKSGLSDKTFREDRHAAEGKMRPEASRRRRCIRLHRILFYYYHMQEVNYEDYQNRKL